MQCSSTLEVVFGGCFIIDPKIEVSFVCCGCDMNFRADSGVGQKPEQTQTRRTRTGTEKAMIDRAAYICFPPKIKRCCTGGIPSFSSTFSLIWATCLDSESASRDDVSKGGTACLVLRLYIQLDLLPCERSDSMHSVSFNAAEKWKGRYLLDQHPCGRACRRNQQLSS